MNISKISIMILTILYLAVPALLQAQKTSAPGSKASDNIQIMKKQIKAAGYTFTVGHNRAMEDMIDQLCGYISPPSAEKEEALDLKIKGLADVDAGVDFLPKRWSWLDHDGVTSIKNQRPAGTCWAFGTVAPLECNILIHDGVEEDISEQYLVSCNNEGMGCNTGGWTVHKYHCVIPPGETALDGLTGAVLESNYPYVCAASGGTPDCGENISNPIQRAYLLDSFAYINNSIEEIKWAIFKYGPVSSSVAVDPYFQAYISGIFNRDYDSFTNHAVSLVGWDDTQGANGVWILRNSWSRNWGENGYMRIEYGCSRVGSDTSYVVYKNGVDNKCGIISFDDLGYSCNATVGIILRDSDLADLGNYAVLVTGDSGDSETVILDENFDMAAFLGNIDTIEGAPIKNDGLFQVALDDIIRLTYIDNDDGLGNTNITKRYKAFVDCVPPVFNGLVSAVPGNGCVTLAWDEADDIHKPIKYNIYRRQDSGGSIGDLIGTTLELSFVDYPVETGLTCYYIIRAADGVENEDKNMVELSAIPLEPIKTDIISVPNDGSQSNGASSHSSVSGDGRCVVFDSTASNLVENDLNNRRDIFLYDGNAETIERISMALESSEANNNCFKPAVNENGRYVVFESYASNLITGDINNKKDIFIYDRVNAFMEIISLSESGVQGNGTSSNASISSNGRFVVFSSFASNLVTGDTNSTSDIFVYDRSTRGVVRVSVSNEGLQGNGASTTPAISGDGRFIAFESSADNLVPGDTNNNKDIFVYDIENSIIEILSLTSSGGQSNGTSSDAAISSDGKFVAFESSAGNLVPDDINGKNDIFVYDMETGFLEMVSKSDKGFQGLNTSDNPCISSNGNFIAFDSLSSNLVSGDTNSKRDIFVYDRNSKTILRVSMGAHGMQGNNDSTGAAISSNGLCVAFKSNADNLVAKDLNEFADIFISAFPLTDADQDGIQDEKDNCRLTPNPNQEDTDQDGYGNICDCDLDNNNTVGPSDFGLFKSAWASTMGTSGWNPDADFDSNEAVGPSDFGIFKKRWGKSAPFE